MQQLARLRRTADEKIPVLLQLAHIGTVAEARRAQQVVLPVGGAAVDAPGREQDEAEQQERNVGRYLATAKDSLELGVADEQHQHRHETREPPADRPTPADERTRHQRAAIIGVIGNARSASG